MKRHFVPFTFALVCALGCADDDGADASSPTTDESDDPSSDDAGSEGGGAEGDDDEGDDDEGVSDEPRAGDGGEPEDEPDPDVGEDPPSADAAASGDDDASDDGSDDDAFDDDDSDDDGSASAPTTDGWVASPEVQRFVTLYCEAVRECDFREFQRVGCEESMLQPCLWSPTPAPVADDLFTECEEYLGTSNCSTDSTDSPCRRIVQALKGLTLVETGEPCGFDVRCADTDLCTSPPNTCGGACVSAGIGEACVEGECAVGSCDGEVCHDPSARSAPNEERVGEAGPCSLSAECQDGLWCVASACQLPGQEGDVCEFDSCAEGLYCPDGVCARKGAEGDACTSRGDCEMDLECYQGECIFVPLTCDPGREPGEPCSLLRQCSTEAGLACDEGLVCVEGSGVGDACEYAEDCVYGLVCNVASDATTGTCSERRPVGSDCESNLVCETALCVEGICGLRPDGEPCAEDAQCGSGHCNADRHCGEKPADCP